MKESKIQSESFTWLWNNYPETRGCFFAVENEGSRVSASLIKKYILEIINNINNTKHVIAVCKKILKQLSGNAIAGAIRKSMGLVAGVADTIFIWKGKIYGVEFKTETGIQSPIQKWWESVVIKHGVTYVIIRSVDEFKEFALKIIL